MRKLGYILLGLLALLMIAGIIGIRYFNNLWFKEVPNHLLCTFEEKPMDFYWTESRTRDHHEPHLAMMLSVKLEGLPNNFYLQYDTGAQTSYLHGNTLKLIKDKFDSKIKIKTIDNEQFIESFNLKVGGNHIETKMINLLPADQDYVKAFNLEDTTSRIKLGTIGADFLVNHVTVIDFKNQQITMFHKLPDSLKKTANFVPFDFTGRRFMLPSKIAGQNAELFYDSGSSSFGLITTKNRFNKYTDPNVPILNLNSNRHGESLSVHHKPSETLLHIGGNSLPIKRVSYVDMYTFLQPLVTPFTRIGGWLGNEPFVDHTLIFDLTGKHQFALIESEGN